MLVVFRILLSLKKTFFKEHLWMAASIKSSTFTRWTCSCVIIISISNDISEFTEHFPGLSKVHYPISDRKDFTLVLTTVVGWQNFINVWCIIILIYDVFSLKMFFFNCCLAAPWPTLGHYWGNSLTYLMLITALYFFGPKVTGSLIMRLGP